MKKILSIIAILGLVGCASNEPVQSETYVQSSGVFIKILLILLFMNQELMKEALIAEDHTIV